MTNHTSKPNPRPTSEPDPTVGPAPDPEAAPGGPLHLFVLLDRSGSMEAIRSEVIGGFNAFVAGQQINGADARLTMVQFDTQDLAETVVDDVPIRQVKPLTRARFQPRGGTPLLDATAHLVARARAKVGDGPVDANVVVVTITDGLENASRGVHPGPTSAR
jgi:Mg-chelatase subunit ChlD